MLDWHIAINYIWQVQFRPFPSRCVLNKSFAAASYAYERWQVKHSFLVWYKIQSPPYSVLIFKTARPIFTHRWIQRSRREKQQKNTQWLCPFSPHITLKCIFYFSTSTPKCFEFKLLLLKVWDPLLYSHVMDNVYDGHDKLFPDKWFCHGLLLPVMWDFACRLKQP